jgi:hypothetical protein
MSAQQAYRDAESVSNDVGTRKSFFATHKLLGVALLLLAVGLALGSYLYLRPNIIVDSIPPFVHHKTAAEIVWKTYTDSKAGFEFKYPEQLSATYISTQTWPPTAKVSDGSFACTPTTQTSGPGKVVRKTSTTPIFCATSQAEGTAGTTYQTYSYTTSSGSKLVTFDFVLGFVDCGVYNEPKMTSCVVEQKAFSVDNLVSQIFATFKFTAPVSTADWKTFTSMKYGFSIKYPTDWEFINEENQTSTNPEKQIFDLNSPGAGGCALTNGSVLSFTISDVLSDYIKENTDPNKSPYALSPGSIFDAFNQYNFSGVMISDKTYPSETINAYRQLPNGKYLFFRWDHAGDNDYSYQRYLLPMLSSIKVGDTSINSKITEKTSGCGGDGA